MPFVEATTAPPDDCFRAMGIGLTLYIENMSWSLGDGSSELSQTSPAAPLSSAEKGAERQPRNEIECHVQTRCIAQ